MFLSILFLKHPILFLLFIHDKFELQCISISLFIVILESNLGFNAFFYTDKYISEQYQNKGKILFLYNLPKSIYSFFFTLAVYIILYYLASSKSFLIRMIFNSHHKDKHNLYKIFKFIKIKIIVYFIILFILSLLF